MKSEKIKLLLVPVFTFLALTGLYGIEKVIPWRDETVYTQAADSRTTASAAGNGEVVSADSSANADSAGGAAMKNGSSAAEQPAADAIPAGYTKMTLVVGQTGNLTDRKNEKEPIYREPDLNAEAAAYLEYNCAVLAKEQQSSYYSGSWVRVDLAGSGDGYVRKDAVRIVNVAFGSENTFYNDIIRNALSHIGAKFKMNGDSLTTGIDCAHFARKMYQGSGVDMPAKAKKIRQAGTVIPNQDRQPGDIIYYDKANNGSGHVGIYLGDGFVDHPGDFKGGFIINSTGHSGKTYPEGGVRIVCLKYPDRTHYETLRFSK